MRRLAAWAAACGVAVAACVVAAAPAAASNVLEVPVAFPTIQAAIDAATNGDEVLVDPGTYFENIDFKGKSITVMSLQGAGVTTIDGGSVAPVVNFSNGEPASAVLQGFTIQHGYPTFAYQYMGGGVHMAGASPTIQSNIITSNTACGHGAGISVSGGSPVIRDNAITANSKVTGCSGDAGGGIYIGGSGSAQIVNNRITHNATDFGGGIALNSAGTPTLLDNTITFNSAQIQGGALWAVNQSDASIVQNMIANNTSTGSGGALYISPPSQTRGPLLVNNTLNGNTGSDSSVYLTGFDAQVQLTNDIIAEQLSGAAVLCDTTYSATPPVFDHNDVVNTAGPPVQGSCSQVVGANGNISANPDFVGNGDLHPPGFSPVVDAGDSTAPSLPATDLDGNPRINGPAVDMGVYEVQRPLAVSPAAGIAAVEGSSLSAVLGHFSGGYGPFNATVDWGDGQTAAATLSGSAISGTHAYAEEGAYTVTLTITDSTATTTSASTSVSVADAPLTVAAHQVSAAEGGVFSGTVATFTDADPNAAATDYGATIVWADGTTSSGSVTSDGSGGFVVSGTHTYAEEGAYNVSVTVSDAGGATASSTAGAAVSDATLSVTAKATVSVAEGASFNGSLLTFTDADPNGTAGDYTATIDWGDQTTSSGTVSAGANPGFAVTGSHTYAEEGQYSIRVTVNDAGGASVTATTSASVADAALTATGGQFSVHHGSSFTVKVATLTDADPGGAATDYTAVVTWGDGTSTSCPGSACTIVRQQNGTFAVSATHVYKKNGKYTVTVQLADAGGARVATSSTITAT